MSIAKTSMIACSAMLMVLTTLSAGGTQTALIQSEVRTARSAFDRAFNLRKPEALDPILARDFVFVNPGRESKGPAETKTTFHRLATTRPNILFVHEPKEVRAYEPWGIVAESGTWYEQWSEPDGKTRIVGRYLATWVLDQHNWRLKNELIVPIQCQGSRYCTK
jgi:hypothetical protein